MAGAVAQIQLTERDVARSLPRHLLKLDDVEWAFGCTTLVRDLRAQGLLKGKRHGATLLFLAEHVADVVERWSAGEFDTLLGNE